LSGEAEPGLPVPETPVIKKQTLTSELQGDVLVVGVDKLLTILAKCCKPVPPDPIIGFVTRGRGITIHRAGCANVSRLSGEGVARLVSTQWDLSKDASYAVEVEIRAQDRQGLLNDISSVLSREKIDVVATRAHSRDLNATMQFVIKIGNVDQLRRVLGLMAGVPGVISASRK
jgi:GTP pyrophosphokinase